MTARNLNRSGRKPGAPYLRRSLGPVRCALVAASLGCVLTASEARGEFGIQQPHPAVARITVSEGAATSYGSGTLIDVRDQFGLVVTNWHVVRDARGPIDVSFPSGEHSKARALKVDPDWDLAALVVWRPNVEPVSLAGTAPQPGDELTICGYGSGVYRAVTGRCTGYYAPNLNLPQQMVELDVQARQGDSGGPIFNDRGELAGVLFGAGHGTTLGSFNGRVESFLATLAPDIGKQSDVELAEVTRRPPKDAPDEMPEAADQSIAATSSRQADDMPWSTPAPEVAAAWKAESAQEESADADSPKPPAASMPLARLSWFAHAKSILAAIGVVAVVAQLVRAAR